MTLQSRIEASRRLSEAIDADINGLTIPAPKKFRLAAALLDQAHEHHRAVHTLYKCNAIGSALSLLRPLLETTFRGLWLCWCASELDVERFISDRVDLSFQQLITDVEVSFGGSSGNFLKLKEAYWSGLCSYAHGGYLPAVRRINPGTLSPCYTESEQIEALSIADFCFVLGAVELFALAGKPDLGAKHVDLFYFGPCAS